MFRKRSDPQTLMDIAAGLPEPARSHLAGLHGMRATYASAALGSLPSGAKVNLLSTRAIEADPDDRGILAPRLTRFGMDLLAYLAKTESFSVDTPSHQSLMSAYDALTGANRRSP